MPNFLVVHIMETATWCLVTADDPDEAEEIAGSAAGDWESAERPPLRRFVQDEKGDVVKGRGLNRDLWSAEDIELEGELPRGVHDRTPYYEGGW